MTPRGLLTGAAAVLLALNVSLSASASAPGDEIIRREHPWGIQWQKSFKKLGRGITNIATCPIELVRTPERQMRHEGYMRGLTYGVVEGAWRTALRGVVGLFEVLTFPAEVPEDYGPLLKPEYVFDSSPSATW